MLGSQSANAVIMVQAVDQATANIRIINSQLGQLGQTATGAGAAAGRSQGDWGRLFSTIGAGVAIGNLAAGAISTLARAIGNIPAAAFTATKTMQSLQVSMVGLLAKEMARGDMVKRTVMEVVGLGEEEQEELAKRTSKYVDLQNAVALTQAKMAESVAAGKAGTVAFAALAETLRKQQEDFDANAVALDELTRAETEAVPVTKTFYENVSTVAKVLPDAEKAAREFTDRLIELGIMTPFSPEQVITMQRQAMAFGYGSEEAYRFVRAMSNVAAGVGANNDILERLVYNFVQIRQAGRITALDVRQLAWASLSMAEVFEVLSKRTGKVIKDHNDFNKAIRSNQITWDDFTAAFEEYAETRWAGASERMTRTLEGLSNKIVEISQVTMYKVFGPAAEDVTVKLNTILDGFMKLYKEGKLDEWGKAVKENLRAVSSDVSQLLGHFSGLTKVIGELGKAIPPDLLKLGAAGLVAGKFAAPGLTGAAITTMVVGTIAVGSLYLAGKEIGEAFRVSAAGEKAGLAGVEAVRKRIELMPEGLAKEYWAKTFADLEENWKRLKDIPIIGFFATKDFIAQVEEMSQALARSTAYIKGVVAAGVAAMGPFLPGGATPAEWAAREKMGPFLPGGPGVTLEQWYAQLERQGDLTRRKEVSAAVAAASPAGQAVTAAGRWAAYQEQVIPWAASLQVIEDYRKQIRDIAGLGAGVGAGGAAAGMGIGMGYADVLARAFPGGMGAALGWEQAYAGEHGGRMPGATDVRDYMASQRFLRTMGRGPTQAEWEERWYKGAFQVGGKALPESDLDELFGKPGTWATLIEEKDKQEANRLAELATAFDSTVNGAVDRLLAGGGVPPPPPPPTGAEGAGAGQGVQQGAGPIWTGYTPPKIPTGAGKFGYQEGGLVRNTTLAWLAERGPEIVIPLSNQRGWRQPSNVGINYVMNVYSSARTEQVVQNYSLLKVLAAAR